MNASVTRYIVPTTVLAAGIVVAANALNNNANNNTRYHGWAGV